MIDKPTQERGHLAWCLLTALQLAKREGKALTPMNQHLFIMQWLARVQKQKRFPKSLAIDIQWLLNQGKMYGFGANLKDKVDYVYHSCTGVLEEQSDLFRLTYAVEVLKSTNWQYVLLTDKAWHEETGHSLKMSALYFKKSELEEYFNDDGVQTSPLSLRFVGEPTALVYMFAQCMLTIRLCGTQNGLHRAEMLPPETHSERADNEK